VAPPANTPPTISDVGSQSVVVNTATGAIPFTVGDAQTAAGSLTVTASSSDTTMVPLSGIVLGGSGANRTVTITPTPGRSGTATITLTVQDGGGLTAADTFQLTVTPQEWEVVSADAAGPPTVRVSTPTGTLLHQCNAYG